MNDIFKKIILVLEIIFHIFLIAWAVFYLCELPNLALLCGGELGIIAAEIVVGIFSLKEDSKN